MTKLVILTKTDRRRFDSPPVLSSNERALYFSLNNTDLQIIQELRTATNKVGFVLQLGYFRSNGKFFTATAEQFRRQDIEYVLNTLNIDPNKINLFSYKKKFPQIIENVFYLCFIGSHLIEYSRKKLPLMRNG